MSLTRACAFSVLLAAAVPAQGTFTVFGSGCAGTAGAPALTASGEHKIGGSTTLQLGSLPMNMSGAVLVGLSSSSWNGLQLPMSLGVIGMNGCDLLVSNEATMLMTTGSGSWSTTFNHPLTPTLINQQLFFQAVVFDPGANPFGATTSNGGDLVFGPACSNGPPQSSSAPFSVQVPSIPNLSTPPINLAGSYTGTMARVCCAGPTSPANGCTFNGSGQVTGSTGPFSFVLPSSAVQEMRNALDAELNRYISASNVRLSMSPIQCNNAALTGNLALNQNDCAGTHAYSGNAGLSFGTVSAVATVSFDVNLVFFSVPVSTTVNCTAQPTGAASISNNLLNASGSVPNVKATKTFTIPVIGISIPFSYTVNTPTLSGSITPVPLPALPIAC